MNYVAFISSLIQLLAIVMSSYISLCFVEFCPARHPHVTDISNLNHKTPTVLRFSPGIWLTLIQLIAKG